LGCAFLSWCWGGVRFDELCAYHAEHGTLPPQSTPSGIGRRVGMRRKCPETMRAERKARLAALAWWTLGCGSRVVRRGVSLCRVPCLRASARLPSSIERSDDPVSEQRQTLPVGQLPSACTVGHCRRRTASAPHGAKRKFGDFGLFVPVLFLEILDPEMPL
jgi:hypothetical protein